jgi:hypothetical protein
VSKNDGGRTTPIPAGADAIGGMTMRNFYKACVMQGLCANPGGPFQTNSQSGWGLVNTSHGMMAKIAGDIADAMLAEDLEFETSAHD